MLLCYANKRQKIAAYLLFAVKVVAVKTAAVSATAVKTTG